MTYADRSSGVMGNRGSVPNLGDDWTMPVRFRPVGSSKHNSGSARDAQ